MKSNELKMGGGARISARDLALIALMLLASSFGVADEMYKYRGPDGEWIYADRPPDDERVVEIRQLGLSPAEERSSLSLDQERAQIEESARLEFPITALSRRDRSRSHGRDSPARGFCEQWTGNFRDA